MRYFDIKGGRQYVGFKSFEGISNAEIQNES